MRTRALPLVGAALVISLVIATEAAAQGRGRPKAPKIPETPTNTTTNGTSTATQERPGTPGQSPATSAAAQTIAAGPVAAFRQFGSWLDDASAAAAGDGRTGIGFGYWRLAGVSQFDAPMVDFGYGVTDRLQVSAAVPFYHVNYAGTTYRGLDDVYIGAKFVAIDPTLTVSEFGLAVSPVLEVLSSGAPEGRVHIGLPVSVELRRQPFRVYGSGGYFSRGSVFAGGAIEWSTPTGAVLTGAINQSYSLKEDLVLDSLGIPKKRVDVMAGVAYPVTANAAAYVSVGRSLTSVDQGGTSLALAGGMSFRFSAAKAMP